MQLTHLRNQVDTVLHTDTEGQRRGIGTGADKDRTTQPDKDRMTQTKMTQTKQHGVTEGYAAYATVSASSTCPHHNPCRRMEGGRESARERERKRGGGRNKRERGGGEESPKLSFNFLFPC